MSLGRRIVEDLGMAEGADILGSWMSHYLAERMQIALEAPNGESGDGARRECSDLILQLWGRRYQSPLSHRMEMLTARLQALVEPTAMPGTVSEGGQDPWVSLKRSLDELHEREARLCLEGQIASLDLSQEREDLRDHSGCLPQEERALSLALISVQGRLTGKISLLGDEAGGHFSVLSDDERMAWVKGQLQLVANARAGIIGR